MNIALLIKDHKYVLTVKTPEKLSSKISRIHGLSRCKDKYRQPSHKL